LTLESVAYVVVFPVVLSKLFLVPIHFVLGQVGALLPGHGAFAKLPADVTEEVVAAIVDVEFVLVVEVLCSAEEAIGVRLVDVLVQRLVSVKKLLIVQNRLVFQAKLAKVNFVDVDDVLAEGLFGGKLLAAALHYGVLVWSHLVSLDALLTVEVNLARDFGLNGRA
jgi:hypothetical protein